MEIPLKRWHAGNCVAVQLLCQDNLMEEWRDSHEEPNIDVTYVAFNGKQIMLPEGAQNACSSSVT